MGVLDSYCRICAYKLKSFRTNIFLPENTHLLKTILRCTPIKIHRSDNFPKNVCSVCLLTLERIYELRAKSYIAYEIFKDILLGVRREPFPRVKVEPGAELLPPEANFTDVDELCRVCAFRLTNGGVNIFLPENRFFLSTIKRYIPIRVRRDDGCSKNVCMLCLKTLSSIPRLYSKSLVAVDVFKGILATVGEEDAATILEINVDDLPDTQVYEEPEYKFNPVSAVTEDGDLFPFDCDRCTRKFQTKLGLTIHVRRCIRRAFSRKDQFSCKACDQRFKFRSEFIAHKRKHIAERPFQCPECPKRFQNKSAMNQHKRLHTGNLSYQCDVCNKTFKQKGNLVEHLTQHFRDISFSSGECPKSFRNKSGLIKRPFPCNHCDKRFPDKSFLKRHLRSHISEKPIKSHFLQHQRNHNGEELIGCQECGKEFSQTLNLVRHKQMHDRKRRFHAKLLIPSD